MPKQVMPLTEMKIKQAKAREKEYSLGDGGGLFLLIKNNGSKLWQLVYTHPILKNRVRLSMGAYPALTLAKARIKRHEAKVLLADDIDPKQHRDKERDAKKTSLDNTLHSVFQKWFLIKESEVSKGTTVRLKARFDNHLFPKLGKVSVDDLTAPLVINIIKKIAEKGNLYSAKKLCAELNQLMRYAVNTGITDVNRLAGISAAFVNHKTINRPALKPEELPELLKTIRNSDTSLLTRYLIYWQLHTMTRPIETVGAKWSEIDLDKKVWNVPKERMKRKKPHSVPLTHETIELLDLIKAITHDSGYLFPSTMSGKTHLCVATANTALIKMGYKDRQCAHGLRSVASTSLNELGKDSDLIEASLAHKHKDKVKEAYDRSGYLERRRELMQYWSGFIEQAEQTSDDLS